MISGPAGSAPKKIVAWSSEAEMHFQANPADRDILIRCALDPIEFMKFWFFQPEGQDKILLGKDLWESQRLFLEACKQFDWIYFLKARQLGESTIECAYDGWHARFGPPNARVHIMSRSETESVGLLNDVKFGLDNLPDWMKLPMIRDTGKEIKFEAGPGDHRVIHAYPSKSPGRGETCTHAHLDEWADMESPAKVWVAVEPSVAPGGTFHILTTGQGPENYSSTYYRKCISKDGKHEPHFIPALSRPGRDAAWYRRELAAAADVALFKREMPLTWEEALAGAGDLYFATKALDASGEDAFGERPAQWHCPKHRDSPWRTNFGYVESRSDFGGEVVRTPVKCPKCGTPVRRCVYVSGWDIGRHKDAAVGTVIDITSEVHQVVAYLRLREQTYPTIQTTIEQVIIDYPGVYLVVEGNNAGEAVIENLALPEGRVKKHTTSSASKARALATTQAALHAQTLKWSHIEYEQLTGEMRGYQLPDAGIVQDSVIALSIAEEYSAEAWGQQGTMLTPFNA